GVVFGVAPAWIGSRSDPADALRGAGRSTGDRSSLVQKPLVILQVAFSIVLLIGAGLVTQSLRNLEDQRFGFVTEGRLIVNIDPSLAGYTPDKLYGLYQRLERALPQIPGVISASLSGYSPLGGNNWNQSGDYEIVGIVEDAKYQDTRGPAYATFFLPLLQTPSGESLNGWVGAIELHVAGKPENLEPAVRKAVAEVDPNLTVLNMMSFGEQVARNFNQERLIARLTELFGALGLVLACVGLYGVTAYMVARRTNEIGIRMALGADGGNVVGSVLRGALARLGVGLAIGRPAALAGGQV